MRTNPLVPMANSSSDTEQTIEISAEVEKMFEIPVKFNASHTDKEIEEYKNSKKESETK